MDNSRHKQGKGRCVAPVQREVLDSLLLDHLAERRIGGIDLGGGSLNGNFLRLPCNTQRDIQRHVLVNLEDNAILIRNDEAGRFDHYVVASRRKGRHHEISLCVGLGCTGEAGTLIYHLHLGGRDESARGVGNCSIDRTQTLRKDRGYRDA